MSRPGPKPSIDSSINERVHIHEQMILLLFDSLNRSPNANANANANESGDVLLQRLSDLNSRVYKHCCSVCNKPYSDAKGLRRHILGSSSEDHEELQRTFRSLSCSLCGQRFSRREQVTKHESNCINKSTAVRRALTESEEESDNPRPRRLPRIMGNAASPYPSYFSRTDLM